MFDQNSVKVAHLNGAPSGENSRLNHLSELNDCIRVSDLLCKTHLLPQITFERGGVVVWCRKHPQLQILLPFFPVFVSIDFSNEKGWGGGDTKSKLKLEVSKADLVLDNGGDVF